MGIAVMQYVRMAVMAVMTAFLAQPAAAQVNLMGVGDSKPVTREEAEKREAQEKAYRDSLRKIPEQKAVNDPWGGVREAGPSPVGGKAGSKPR